MKFWGTLMDSLVFQPPDSPSYEFVRAGDDMRLKLLATGQTMYDADAGWWMTSRGNSIAYVGVRSKGPARAGIVLSHGNSGDISCIYDFAVSLSKKLRCDVLCYDYSGYGLSTGSPSEQDFYSDAEAAVEVLRERYGHQDANTLLYGLSLGTAACVKLAADGSRSSRSPRPRNRRRFAGVVLQAPLASAGRCAWSGFQWLPCVDRFNSAGRIGRVRCPVMVVHDVMDDVVPYQHGLTLCRLCPTAWPLVVTVGMGHIVPFDRIQDDVQEFVDKVVTC